MGKTYRKEKTWPGESYSSDGGRYYKKKKKMSKNRRRQSHWDNYDDVLNTVEDNYVDEDEYRIHSG